MAAKTLPLEPNLPWVENAEDRLFRRMVIALVILFIIMGIIVNRMTLPEVQQKKLVDVSPRLAKLILEKKKEQDFELEANVLPTFRGWTGRTVFELDNGQVWRQRQAGTMTYSGSDATVTITRNWLGKYVLEHQETGRAIGVKRID